MTVAFITGTSRGVGRATALALGARGARVVCLSRSSREQLETERLLEAASVAYRTFACELTSPEELAAAVNAALELWGAPDCLINNAGVIERAPVVECTDEVWQRQLDVNLTAPFRAARAVLPAMLAAGRGRIVNVGSVSSVTGTARQSAYHASKWGLVGFMKCLAEELSGTGLMTCAVLPGSIDTDMLTGSGFEPRMTAEDVARTLTYCALDAPLAHNGAMIEMFGT